MTATQQRNYSWMISTGRISRGRTIVDISFDDELVISAIAGHLGWSEGQGRSAIAYALSKMTISITRSPARLDDVPWSPGLVFASQRVRELLAFCEDQLVWAPVRFVGEPTPSRTSEPFFPLLPVHWFNCCKPLPNPPERISRIPFELDVDKIPSDIHIFCAVEWPGRLIVSDRVKDAIVKSRIKRAYFSEPTQRKPLW